MKKYTLIIMFVVFILSLTINVSALAQFTSDLISEGAAPILDPTTLLLIGMGLFGLTGVSRKKLKK